MGVLHYLKKGVVKTILKFARTTAGLTQKAIAQQINMSVKAYQNYELGIRTPNVYTAQKIAQALKSTISEIFPIDNDNSITSQ